MVELPFDLYTKILIHSLLTVKSTVNMYSNSTQFQESSEVSELENWTWIFFHAFHTFCNKL